MSDDKTPTGPGGDGSVPDDNRTGAYGQDQNAQQNPYGQNQPQAQNPYGQGYIGAYALDLIAGGCSVKADAPFIQTPQTARFIDSGTLLISSANIDSYAADLKQLTGELQASFKDKFLAC